jgi:hypothetical protein
MWPDPLPLELLQEVCSAGGLKMDIYAKKGTKVKFVEKDPMSWGVNPDNAKHLLLNETYTVERTDVHSWHTRVYLQEVPDIPFSSVWFK